MTNLTIVADIKAVSSKDLLVKEELEKLVPITRAESGCIQYDLHQDNADPSHFIFYEIWESRELWQIHMNSPHIAAYAQATEGAVETFTLYEMTRTV